MDRHGGYPLHRGLCDRDGRPDRVGSDGATAMNPLAQLRRNFRRRLGNPYHGPVWVHFRSVEIYTDWSWSNIPIPRVTVKDDYIDFSIGDRWSDAIFSIGVQWGRRR